ncbi:sensor histidine kinase [Agathobaculum sp. Marseille-P7918]|uniref:sensor histidine kinase n=1 Tax=Agathobaculum sp. Marseille-P7918 TaxID=2479843 RepID=UPI000F643D8E|nr:sensor histidine kinase [Agathobaculum sp. Marseille-P7918]
MNCFWKSIKRNALWLFALLIMDIFSALLLWLTDVQAFWTLLILILLWSFMFFVVVLAYVNIKEKKKQKIFQTFISDPDVVNEEKLLQVVSQQEREQIQLLALVLRDNRLRLCNLSEELRDYEEYVESWVHEAKTPLALLTMIMDNRADELPFEIQTKLDYVCNQLQEDITQMLYYARLKSSTKDYRFEELDLQSLLKDVLADYEPLLEEKHFVIKNEVKEEQVFTDRRGLQFMLGQIISNVIKYSTDNPMLTTSTQHTTREIILSITDNGSGVKSYDLPYIFQKGFTGDSANNRNKATGMGLYLTKKMADDLNLKLDVQSEYNSFFKISIRFPI